MHLSVYDNINLPSAAKPIKMHPPFDTWFLNTAPKPLYSLNPAGATTWVQHGIWDHLNVWDGIKVYFVSDAAQMLALSPKGGSQICSRIRMIGQARWGWKYLRLVLPQKKTFLNCSLRQSSAAKPALSHCPLKIAMLFSRSCKKLVGE